MKKLISVLISVLILSGSCVFTYADSYPETYEIGGFLNVISFNVDGLPVPSFLSSTNRPPLKATRILADEVKNSGCDIFCAQEDFNFHNTLKYGLEMEYSTLTSGGAGIGDGLNIFSKYPVYNVERVAWESAFGVFDCGSDELTPKGFLCCTVEISENVFVDVYTLHADAWEDEHSMQAKADQFDQLKDYIDSHSGRDRAVILTGDFNTNYSVFRSGYKSGNYKVDLYGKLMDCFVNQGFKDAWVEAQNNGDYDIDYSQMYSRFGCPYQRTWDTLDHIFYRDGGGVSFVLNDCTYESFDGDGVDWGGHVSDHAAVRAVLQYNVDYASLNVPDEKITETFNLFESINCSAYKLCALLFKVFANLPSLFENGIGWIK